MTFAQIAGILPAVVFPAATLVQLVRMVRANSAAGVVVAKMGTATVTPDEILDHFHEQEAI